MTTEPKPCTIKGCPFNRLHHHPSDGAAAYGCGLNEGFPCLSPSDAGPTFAPRVAKSARIAALEAENAALIEQGWADAKVIAGLTAKLAAKPTVSLEPFPSVRGAVTVSIDGAMAGMVFDNVRPSGTYHATSALCHLSSFHPTQAEAVAATVTAWQVRP